MKVNPDKPVTVVEYEKMRAHAAEYEAAPPKSDLEREDRAFLLHQIYKYEAAHELSLTYNVQFTDQEVAWWQQM